MPKTVVVLRFPFERNGFVSPQNINWNQEKQQKLWSYVTQVKNSNNSIDTIDWKYLSNLLKVDSHFLQKQVYYLYEKELSFLKTQLSDQKENSRMINEKPMSIEKLMSKNEALQQKVSQIISDLNLEDVEPEYENESYSKEVTPEPHKYSVEINSAQPSVLSHTDPTTVETLRPPRTPKSQILVDTLTPKDIPIIKLPGNANSTLKNTSYFQGSQSILNKLKPTTTITNLHILTKPIPTVSPIQYSSTQDQSDRYHYLKQGSGPTTMRRSSSMVTVSLPSYIKDQIRLESKTTHQQQQPLISESPFITDEESISGDSLENVAINSQSLYQSHFNSNEQSFSELTHNSIDEESDDDDYLFNNTSTITNLQKTVNDGAVEYKPKPHESKLVQPVTSDTRILKKKSFKQTILTSAADSLSNVHTSDHNPTADEYNNGGSNDISSFSDFSTASVSKSALEKVLMDNIYT